MRAPAVQHPGWFAAAAAVLVMVAAPVAGLVHFATRPAAESLWPHLAAFVLPGAAATTGWLLLGVGVLVTLVGAGTAWLVAMYEFPGRRVLEWALLLPLAIPTYIVAFVYLDLLHPAGPVQGALRDLLGITHPRALWFPEVRSLGGACAILAAVLFPYVYLPTRAALVMESGAVLMAARGLGAGAGRLLWRVALPLARPAIAAGASLALLETINDIGATTFLGLNTLTVAIYTTWLNRSSIEGASQIALVLLVVILVPITLERAGRNRRVGAADADAAIARRPLAGMRAVGATVACAVPLVAGFVVPAAYLAVESLRRLTLAGVPAELLLWTRNSVAAAATATAVTVALGLLVAYAARLMHSRLARGVVHLAAVGYAIPGTVLAVGLLVPLAAFDNAIDDFFWSRFGTGTGLILTGSGAALVLAYSIRFLAVAAGSIEAGFAKIPPAMDMSARSLGARPGRVLARVHVPILRPALAAAALLVFVDCMKELPATLLLRPFDFETLATHIYGEAARGVYEDGAIAALAIVAVGIVPVLVLARFGARSTLRI